MDPQDQLTVLDYWRVIWRARGWIFALTTLAAVVAFVIGYLQPKVYTATATILPPKESNPQSFPPPLGALFLGTGGVREGGGVGFTGIQLGGALTITTNQDIFVALLKSRTMRQETVAELAKTWGPSVIAMVKSVTVAPQERGIIGITVEARDRKLAADLANYYFVHLDQLLERYAYQATKRQEKFYTAQLERAAKEVEAAEEALLKFQAENRIIPVDAVTRGAVESSGSLRGVIMALEMQREIMQMRFTDQHPQMRELEKQIAELKRQYSKNLFGEAMDLPPESPTAKGSRKEFFVAAAKTTPVQFAFLKLYRNLKIQEAFYTTALQGLQQIKYSGGVYYVGVETLDAALPPPVHSWPNLPLIVAVAAGSALIIGILLAFFLEHLRRVRELERQTRPPVSARGWGPDDGSKTARIPEGEQVRTVEPEGVPVAHPRGQVAAGGE